MVMECRLLAPKSKIRSKKIFNSTQDVCDEMLVPLLGSITQLFGTSYVINCSFLHITPKLDDNCREQTRKLVLHVINYARKSCWSIHTFWNALIAPMNAVFYCKGWSTSKTAGSPVLSVQKQSTRPCRALQKFGKSFIFWRLLPYRRPVQKYVTVWSISQGCQLPPPA